MVNGANDWLQVALVWSSAAWPACWHGGNDIVVAVTIEVLPLGRAESGYFLAAICLFPELATVLVVGLCSQDLRRAMARCAPLSRAAVQNPWRLDHCTLGELRTAKYRFHSDFCNEL